MKKLQVSKEIERMEDELDLKEALKAIKEIESGKDKLVAWDDLKNDFRKARLP